MRFRSAVTNLKVILILDLIIVASASGGYYYIQTQFGSTVEPSPPSPKPAEFQVTNMTLNRFEAYVGQPIIISVIVTNVGESLGNYSVGLVINDVLRENKTIQLFGGESKTVEFTVTEANEGTYEVTIETLTEEFKIIAPSSNSTTPSPASFSIRDAVISPYEACVGDPVSISAEVTNDGDLSGEYSVNLTINGEAIENKIVQLQGKETKIVEFTVTESNVGEYLVRLGFFVPGIFTVVPAGYHTLSINAYSGHRSYRADDLEFTLDGQPKKTPFEALVSIGTHTIVMPIADPTGQYIFEYWEDNGSKDPTRTIRLTSAMSISASYSGGGTSCPSLYIWNGNSSVYVADVSNHGWLGYIKYINEDGSVAFWRNNPWDYIPLDKSQLQPDSGYYDLTLIQRYDEIFYLDSAYILAVDHPSTVNVYSTMVEEYIDPNYMGKIYAVSQNPLTPISAINEKGEDVLPQISMMDGIFTPGTNGLNSPSWDNITWNRLTLNLGDLSSASQIKLVVRGIVDWGSPDDYSIWLEKFFTQPVPNGTQVTPPPYMEVKDEMGNWVPIPESRQFPIPPDAVPRTFVVDLTGLFPTNDYSLRISNFWNVTFDYIGVDTTPQENLTIQMISPHANLYQAFSTASISAGNFTRYGDVTQLMLNADDEFVIGKQGDVVSLQFPVDEIMPPPENSVRDFFFIVSCWFKDANGNWGFGFGFTVDPLPFYNMSGFPYPPTESYPYDAHLSYIQEYNTRLIVAP